MILGLGLYWGDIGIGLGLGMGIGGGVDVGSGIGEQLCAAVDFWERL